MNRINMTNAPSESVYAERIAQVIELLQGKWTAHVLCALCKRPVRLGELRRALPSASKKSLTASLRSLEAAHVVLRRDLSGPLLHVEYQLTELYARVASASSRFSHRMGRISGAPSRA